MEYPTWVVQSLSAVWLECVGAVSKLGARLWLEYLYGAIENLPVARLEYLLGRLHNWKQGV